MDRNMMENLKMIFKKDLVKKLIKMVMKSLVALNKEIVWNILINLNYKKKKHKNKF